MARSLGAAALGFLAISLAFPQPAHALAIHSFTPADVTLGTRLVIKGDFTELVASGARPKVQGTRIDTSRTVKFQVLAVSRRTIIARVREVPSSKSDPAAGKTWSLRVRSAIGSGAETAEADGTFTTAAPALVALFDPEARPGDLLSLYALDPGQGEGSKRATVKVGGKKASVLDLRPVGPSPDDDPWRVRFRAPNLRNGFYPVKLQNSIGKSSTLAEVLIFGGLSGGLVPFVTAAVESRPALEAPLCSATAGSGGLHVSACDGPDCTRALDLEFEPDPTGGYRPASVSLRELAADGTPTLWVAAQASARLVPSPGPELVAGTFIAELQPAGDPSPGTSAPRLRMRGYFQAPNPEALQAP